MHVALWEGEVSRTLKLTGEKKCTTETFERARCESSAAHGRLGDSSGFEITQRRLYSKEGSAALLLPVIIKCAL